MTGQWTKSELKILREAWLYGMGAKNISAKLLKHRTPQAIHCAMHRYGMRFNNYGPYVAVRISIPGKVYDWLKHSAATQSLPINKLCINIIKNEMDGLNVPRTGSYSKEYRRAYLREWRARKRQEGPTE